MRLLTRLKNDVVALTSVLRVLRRTRHLTPDNTVTLADDLERWVRDRPDNVAIYFEDRTLTYDQMDEQASRYAHWALSTGIGKGDRVALLMENRPEFLIAWFGLAKIGAVAVLINTHLHGPSLAHCLTISQAGHLILGEECLPAYRSAAALVEQEMIPWITGGTADGIRNLDVLLDQQPADRIGRAQRQGLKTGDLCCFIYTSGTTGLPKAARLTHLRVGFIMHAFAASSRAREADRMYIPLPLYHTSGGICAVGAAMTVGGSVIIRRQFSASRFWEDCVKYEATMFQYIGELCRYLLHSPHTPAERQHKVRICIGNGLRPDIWNEFKNRFGIPHILEFYGSTEGNVSLMNYDGKPGSIGRVPGFLKSRFPYALVEFDVEKEQPVRGPDGFCREAPAGEVGEMVGQIKKDIPRSDFAGYADKRESENKILRDVFAKGDAWFRTGDLMRKDKLGYYYFVDRVGDTFRWKGENVSTAEVSHAIADFDGVREANVYGVHVPRTEGRAGMAALILEEGVDLNSLHRHLRKTLPDYAVPLFLRISKQMAATGTFKHHKLDLVREGFDPERVSDPLYFEKSAEEGYVPLDKDLYRKICKGEVRI